MKTTNNRTITLAEAIRKFNIEELAETDLADPLSEQYDEDHPVLVFDGDTEFTKDIDIAMSQAPGEERPYHHHNIIIVNGNLKARNIHMWCLNGLFVFGDMQCEKIHFRESCSIYVQGNLTAKKAILATAEQEGAGYGEATMGADFVRIMGQVHSPRIQTWFMPLNHLNFTADSGKEFEEGKEYINNDNRLSDPVWKFNE